MCLYCCFLYSGHLRFPLVWISFSFQKYCWKSCAFFILNYFCFGALPLLIYWFRLYSCWLWSDFCLDSIHLEFEFVGLCLDFAADNSSFSFIQVSQLMLIIFGSFNCNLKIDSIPFNPIFNSFSRILSFLDFNCHIN